MAETTRPLPVPDIDSRPYWEAAKRHRLMLLRCRACGQYLFPPRPACGRCHGTGLVWTELSGRGTVYTYTIMHDTLVRGLTPPYVVALVEPEEAPGVRITSNILDCPPDEVHIGMPVEVCFEEVTDEVTLPQFRPRR